MYEFKACLRIARIEQSIINMESRSVLARPLLERLLPISSQFDMDGVNKSNRTIKLVKHIYPAQFKYGINRCVGFDIIWI
jgi:hypothetical protein